MSTLLSSSLSLSLHAANAGGAPDWIQLVPAGTFSGLDGRGPYVNDRPADVVAMFEREANRLPLDENHATALAAKTGMPSPARGWIVALQVRDGSIWGQVEWTNEGRALMTDKAYGFLSPVFLHPPRHPYRVAKLTSVALTNSPNLNQLKSLHTKQETAMLEELRKALGLPETADEAAVLAAVSASHAAQAAHVALMGRLVTVAGLAADATPDALVTALQAKTVAPTATGDQVEEITKLKGTVTALQNQLTGYVKETSEDKAKATISKAIVEGKIPPSMRDHYVARHVKDAAEVDKEISLLPSIHSGGLAGRDLPKTTDGTSLSAEEASVMAMMGVDEKTFLETHKTLHGKAVL